MEKERRWVRNFPVALVSDNFWHIYGDLRSTKEDFNIINLMITGTEPF